MNSSKKIQSAADVRKTLTGFMKSDFCDLDKSETEEFKQFLADEKGVYEEDYSKLRPFSEWLEFLSDFEELKEVISSEDVQSAKVVRRNNMTREDLDYQGHYMRERMEEIKREIKDEYFEVLNFDDPMDHYAGYDSSQDRIEGWIEDKAKEYGVSFDLMSEACNELDREAMDAGYAEMEWAYTPGNLTPEEFDAWYEGKLDIRYRIKSSKKIQSANLFAPTTPCDVMLDNGKVAPAGCEFEVSYDRNEQGEYILGIKVKGLGKGSVRFDSEAEAKKDGWIVSKAIKSDAESEQKLKEDLIRQGYTEEEATQIVEQRKPENVESSRKSVDLDI